MWAIPNAHVTISTGQNTMQNGDIAEREEILTGSERLTEPHFGDDFTPNTGPVTGDVTAKITLKNTQIAL